MLSPAQLEGGRGPRTQGQPARASSRSGQGQAEPGGHSRQRAQRAEAGVRRKAQGGCGKGRPRWAQQAGDLDEASGPHCPSLRGARGGPWYSRSCHLLTVPTGWTVVEAEAQGGRSGPGGPQRAAPTPAPRPSGGPPPRPRDLRGEGPARGPPRLTEPCLPSALCPPHQRPQPNARGGAPWASLLAPGPGHADPAPNPGPSQRQPGRAQAADQRAGQTRPLCTHWQSENVGR